MKRKDYKIPKVNVVLLRQQSPLLAGSTVSSGSAGVTSYTWHEESDE